MNPRTVRMGSPPAVYQPPFRHSWRALAVYAFLVTWTPILSIRPLPPFRFDDAWLVLLFLVQLPRAGRYGSSMRYFPMWGYLLLAASFALSAATSVAVGAGLADLYDAFIYVRLAMVTWVVAQTHLPARDVFKLFAAFAFSCLLMYPILFVQERGIQPWSQWTVGLWSIGEKYRRALQHAGVQARAIGTVGNPNFAGFFVWCNAAVSIALIAAKPGLTSRVAKMLLLANAVVSLPVILLLLKSRSALVCFAVAGFYALVGILVIARKRNAIRVVVMVAVVLGLLALAAYCSRDLLPRRIREFLEPQSSGAGFYSKSLEPRLRLWGTATRRITESDRILLGFGESQRRVIDSGFVFTFYRQGILGLIPYFLLWLWGVGRSTAGWFVGSREPQDRFVFLVAGVVLIGSLFFELTAEGLISPKMGPIIAMTLGVLQRPIRDKSRRQRGAIAAVTR